jgi:hypothetical protein
MRWWGTTMVVAIVGTTMASAAHWSFRSTDQGASMQEDCSACHARSAPRTHTRSFVDYEHGPVALASREDCLGCHEDTKQSCDDCHLERAPDWHTDDFRNPVLGTVETREHIRIAGIHRDSCVECHDTTYMTRCAECHRPEEGWLGRGGRSAEEQR